MTTNENNTNQNVQTRKALFAAGCFWGVEQAFRDMDGVINTSVGYTGGDFDNPSYEDVCSGRTGHAETVQVEFDPDRVTYAQLVEKFFTVHDPTTKNRQGPDIGSQYRSAIFYLNDQQKQIANETVNRIQSAGRYKRKIVTQIEPAKKYWLAEDYHQQYYEKRGIRSCRF